MNKVIRLILRIVFDYFCYGEVFIRVSAGPMRINTEDPRDIIVKRVKRNSA